MEYMELLDQILLSDNVCEEFFNKYNNDNGFQSLLNEILPEVEQCNQQVQNNPWHIYNVLGHILHSVDEMNKQSKNFDGDLRRILAYTMFLHDIGKPECHIVRQKDGRNIDSFFDHNIASERIARRVLPYLNFSSKEIEIISKLVFKHDIFMFIRLHNTQNKYYRTLTFDLLKQEIADLNNTYNGYEMMKYLIMVGRSDNLSQNPKMTGESLRLLDKMEDMIDELQACK